MANYCACGKQVYPGHSLCRNCSIDAMVLGLARDEREEVEEDSRRMNDFLNMSRAEQRRLLGIASTFDGYVSGVGI